MDDQGVYSIAYPRPPLTSMPMPPCTMLSVPDAYAVHFLTFPCRKWRFLLKACTEKVAVTNHLVQVWVRNMVEAFFGAFGLCSMAYFGSR